MCPLRVWRPASIMGPSFSFSMFFALPAARFVLDPVKSDVKLYIAMIRLAVIVVLCIGNAVPRGTAVCCAQEAAPARSAQRAQTSRHCCCSARSTASNKDAPPGKQQNPADDGRSCASPCCAKAPATVSLLNVKPLESTPTRAVLASYDAPEAPTHGAIFHPPKV